MILGRNAPNFNFHLRWSVCHSELIQGVRIQIIMMFFGGVLLDVSRYLLTMLVNIGTSCDFEWIE